ncbi:MAG: hypothetical protein QOD37_1078 [Gaiellales bacterium]|nr:hypothetical protein [Gaiellales bacterium]
MTFRSIVIGTDGSDTASQALGQAIELAAPLDATLHVVSAYAPVKAARLHAEAKQAPEDWQWAINPQEDVEATLRAAADAAGAAGVEACTHARPGDPADAIIGVAEEQNADLIIVGNKGMTGVKRIMGSVPNKVSHHAPCSVLIVRTT